MSFFKVNISKNRCLHLAEDVIKTCLSIQTFKRIIASNLLLTLYNPLIIVYVSYVWDFISHKQNFISLTYGSIYGQSELPMKKICLTIADIIDK